MSKAIYPIKMSPQGIYRVCERYEEAQSGETMSEKEIDNVKKINDTHFDASFVALKQTNTRIPHPHIRNRSLRRAYFLSRAQTTRKRNSNDSIYANEIIKTYEKLSDTTEITTNMCLALLHTFVVLPVAMRTF